MGCAKSRPLAVVPGPSVAATAASTRQRPRRSRILSFIGLKRDRGERFTREQRQLIAKHLPSIPIYELSTPVHLGTAARHWGDVYKEGTASGASKRSQGSWGRESTKQSSALRELYDAFYQYLEQHSPELMPVFRASLQVRGKVLVHISAGMRSILASPDAAAKMAHLTQTHLRVGVKLEHFDPLAVALLHAMERTSGVFWTPEVAEAWKRLFVHCAAMLMVEQKKAESATVKSSRAPSQLSAVNVVDGFRATAGNSIRELSSSGWRSKTSLGRA